MTTHTPTIAEQAHGVGSRFRRGDARRVMAAFAADQAALDARRCARLAFGALGTVMPDGDLLDVHGAPTSLAQLARADAPRWWCSTAGRGAPTATSRCAPTRPSWCRHSADRGVELIAISPQKPDGSLTAAESNELTYSVASDPGNQLAAALGILTEASADALAGQVKLGLDVTEVNADGARTLPMPTVVVVDAAGIIRWIDVHPNYATRSEVPDILARRRRRAFDGTTIMSGDRPRRPRLLLRPGLSLRLDDQQVGPHGGRAAGL